MDFSFDELKILWGDPKGPVSSSIIIDNVHFDSRKIKKSGLFIALKGEEVNGSNYYTSAVKNGADVVLISETDVENVHEFLVSTFVVKDSLASFGDLARLARSKFQGEVVSVIGSAGKTTTKNLLKSAGGKDVYANEASFNNETGVPLTLCAIPATATRAVVELGESHFGDIDHVASMALPGILVVTNVGDAHLEWLKDHEGVAKTLNEAVLLMKEDGKVVIPSDINCKDILLSGSVAEVFEVDSVENLPEKSEPNKFYVTQVKANKDQTYSATFTFNSESVSCHIPLTGKHFVLDAALAVCASVLAGDTLESASSNISNTASEGHRMRIVTGDRITLFDDCYNANPSSMKACIDTLKDYASQNKSKSVMVMGRMAELGDSTISSHSQVVAYALDKKIDQIVCVGPDMKSGLEKLSDTNNIDYFENAQDCARSIKNYIEGNTVIAVKASRGPNPARPLLLDVVEFIEEKIEEEKK